MSKKRQTTGLPSKDNISNSDLEYRTRAERDEQIQKWLVRGTTILGAVIVLVLLIYVVVNQIIIPGQAVATVNGDPITVQEFQDRVRIERARLQQEVNRTVSALQGMGMDPNQFFQQEPYSTWLSELNFPDQLGQRVLDDIIEDRLIAEEIASRDITIDEAAVEKQVNNYFSYDPTQVALIGVDPTASPTATITPTPFVSPTPSPVPSPTATPTENPEATEEATDDPEVQPTFTLPPEPTQSPDDVRQNYEQAVQDFRTSIQAQAGVSAADMDAYFERLTLRAAIRDAISEGVSSTLYANARHILVPDETQALDIVTALNNGESFSAIARAVSQDSGSGSRGGELGWSPVNRYVPEFRDAVTEAPIGEIFGPVESEFGFHVIQVRAREDREVEGSELENIKDIAFGEWLTQQRESEDNSIEISDSWTDYVPE